MPKCAFLSIANTEGWFIDDDLVHTPLERLGWEVENIPWNQTTDWNQFDLVIIRSPWDYQDHIEAFLKVLETIDQSSTILLNSLDTVKWNINKNYLFELEKKGIELIPTLKFNNLQKADIEQAFEKLKTKELIIKPIVGANADDTYRINPNDTERFQKIEVIFKNKECLVQPFVQSIVDEGEFSLMYFKGYLSHAILKTVGAGDYRVQEEHGGGVVAIKKLEVALREAGEKAMEALPNIPLYARVDLVRTPKDTFALMELELIEPCLYFRFDDASAAKFAHTIDAYWRNLKNENT